MTSIPATTAPDTAVRSFLSRTRSRLRVIDVLHGAAAGFLIAAVLVVIAAMTVVPWSFIGGASAIIVVAVAAGYVLSRRRNLPGVADTIERRAPGLQNLLHTAAELLMPDAGATPTMRSLVFEQATSRARALHLPHVLPIQKPLLVTLSSAALWAAMLWVATPAGVRVRESIGASAARTIRSDIIGAVRVTVSPPAYTGIASNTSSNPERLQVMRGSRLQVDVESDQPVELIHGTDTSALRKVDGRWRGVLTVREDGYVLLRARDGAGSEGRRLIGLTASEDRQPVARITKPGRDLFLLDSTATIDVALDASDDLALASLRLRYTKVSGSGERFTFTEGEVPIAIQRSGARQWTARGQLRLAQLALAQGDMVVYRAVAADRQPGVAPAESDAYIVEIIGVGGDAAAGFSIDPEQDRYAVSQQMVILKTERLIANRAQMSSEALLNASRELSIEQRRVRAEFVFMMGGELAEEITAENSMGDLDESHEAEGESDLSAGRMANRGRTALLAAIRAMSRAATALNVGDLDRGLVNERTAVRELERAFTRTRYLLRAFTEREQLDLSRRLSGNLEDARSSQRSVLTVDDDTAMRQLRVVLDRIAAAGADSSDRDLALAAEEILRVDPSSRELQLLSTQLSRAARARAGSRERIALVDSVTLAVTGRLSRALPDAAAGSRDVQQRQMHGVLRDVLQRSGRNDDRRTPPRDTVRNDRR